MSKKEKPKKGAFNSIKTKLILVMAAVCIIPLLAAAIISYINLNKIIHVL